ncbi:MAG: DUF4212 domain-containing protein [Verrucomicrobiales bacterium]
MDSRVEESTNCDSGIRIPVRAFFQGFCFARLERLARDCFTTLKMEDLEKQGEARQRYWRGNLRIVMSLLAIWFVVSFGFAILWRDWADATMPKVGTAPFGFWMAQQGSIICFVLLLVLYAFLMNRLDAKHGLIDEEEEGAQ